MRASILAGLVAAVVLSACGGRAVVERDGDLGAGGHGVGGSGAGASVPACATPDPVGDLNGCSSGVSGGGECAAVVCDGEGNVWEQSCTATTCVCTHNFQTKCTCALNGPGDFCGGTPKCCPAPWE